MFSGVPIKRIGAGAAGEALGMQAEGCLVMGARKFLLLRHVIVDRALVGLGHGITLVIGFGLVLARPAHDMAGGEDADARGPRVAPRARMSAMCALARVDIGKGREQEIG